MGEIELSDLFRPGSAPETDPAFERRVTDRIGRERLGLRLGGMALRVAAVLTAAGAVFVTGRAVRPALAPLVDAAPLVMGAPLPLVLAVLAAGLAAAAAASARRYLLSL